MPKLHDKIEDAEKEMRKKGRGNWFLIENAAGKFLVVSEKQKNIFYKKSKVRSEMDFELLKDFFSIPADKLSPAQKKSRGIK